MDLKIIEEKDLLDQVSSVCKNVTKIWHEIGVCEVEKEIKMRDFRQTILETLRQIERGEQNFREKIIKRIDKNGSKLYQLGKQLSMENVCEPYDDLNLLELDKFLKEKLAQFEEIAEGRLSELKSLQEKEQDLCSYLDEDCQVLPPDPIPSLDTLEMLSKIIKSLDLEKEHRQKSFNSLRTSIKFYMEDLDIPPYSIDDRDLVFSVEGTTKLSLQNINKLKQLSSNLAQKTEREKSKETELWEHVRNLWDRLEIDEDTKNALVKDIRECTSLARTNTKLKGIVDEFEKLKQQNIGKFVNRLRLELESWWDKCYICDDEKENFSPYFLDDYDDSVLEAHEKEVARLKQFYEENKDLFTMIEKWMNLWEKVAELEEKAHMPGRLFGNRGGGLLKEERERKRVTQELPKLELAIQARIDAWEESRGRAFLVRGMSLTAFIKSHWDRFNEDKNRKKEIRQTKKTKQLEQEARLGTKVPSRKRQLADAHHINTSAKFRRNDRNERTPTSTTFSSVSSTSSVRSKHNVLRPRNHTSGSGAKKSKSAATHAVEITSYDQFSEGIENINTKEQARSSILPRYAKNLTLRSPLKSCRLTPLNGTAASRTRFLTPTSTSRTRFLTPTTTPMATPSSLRRSSRLNSSRVTSISGRRHLSVLKTPHNGSRLTPVRNKLSFLM